MNKQPAKENGSTSANPSEKHTSLLSQIILEDLLHQIMEGKLHPGDKLPPERHWAEKLNVSRAALREAIRAMQIIGLVSSRQGEGTYINNQFESTTLFQPMTISYWLNGGTVNDVHQFRRGIEIMAAEQAALRASDEDIAVMRELNQKMLDESQDNLGTDYDRALHNKIAEVCGNCLIKDSLGSASALLDDLVYRLRVVIFEQKEDAEALTIQHQNIIDAIAMHNPEHARKAMAEHMAFVSNFIERAQQEQSS